MSRTAVLSLASLLTGVLVFAIACETAAPAAPKAPAAKAEKAAPAPKAPAAKAEPAGPTMGGALSVALNSEARTLDGNNTTDITSRRIAAQVTEKLMLESVDGKEYVPGLLEKWSVSPDGLTYTFDLRPGVKFHDGTAFDAEAVKFSLERQFDKEHPHRYDGAFSIASRFFGALNPVVAVVNPTQVTITVGRRDAGVFQYLTTMPGFMPSPTAVKELANDYGKNPVGTGPWKFVEWEPDVRVVFERNEDYWGKPALADRLILLKISEPAARVTSLVTGEINLVIDVPAELLDILEADENITVTKALARRVAWLNMNGRTDGEEGGVEAFQDKRVRWAVAHAIDRRRHGRQCTSLAAPLPRSDRWPVLDPGLGQLGSAPGLKKYRVRSSTRPGRSWRRPAGRMVSEVTLTILGGSSAARRASKPIATDHAGRPCQDQYRSQDRGGRSCAALRREEPRAGSAGDDHFECLVVSRRPAQLHESVLRTDQQFPPNGIEPGLITATLSTIS